MNDFIDLLESSFTSERNIEIAIKQKAYMRGQFDYFGLKTETRRTLQKPFLDKNHLPNKEELEQLIKILWNKPQRDFQLFGQELVFKYIRKFELSDIELLEYMASHKSWWDTVDYIAYKLMGSYFIKFPEQQQRYVDLWLDSNNIWLQRCALLFQLKYKEDLNTELLANSINRLLGSKEFFINKAIGWVLREYSRTNPQWVLDFTNQTDLAPLSKKEALRLIK